MPNWLIVIIVRAGAILTTDDKLPAGAGLVCTQTGPQQSGLTMVCSPLNGERMMGRRPLYRGRGSGIAANKNIKSSYASMLVGV